MKDARLTPPVVPGELVQRCYNIVRIQVGGASNALWFVISNGGYRGVITTHINAVHAGVPGSQVSASESSPYGHQDYEAQVHCSTSRNDREEVKDSGSLS
jgi:hypothetical protein